MRSFHVTFFYLATGMEGHADTRDYGVVLAETAEDAKKQVVEREWGGASESDKRFISGCLSAKSIEGSV